MCRLVDWFAVRVTPMHLGLEATGPLCTALSPFRQLQRRSTPRKHQRPLLAREEIGREMADLILPVTQLPCNDRVL
jgi:hypothetical protein